MPVSDASLPLQKAIVAVLTADVPMIAGRVYDAVPMNAPMPYVSFGPFQLFPEQGDCLDGATTTIQLDCWALGPSTVEVKQLGAAVAAALDERALTLDAPNVLVDLKLIDTLFAREPDGITAHGIITITAHTEPRD